MSECPITDEALVAAWWAFNNPVHAGSQEAMSAAIRAFLKAEGFEVQWRAMALDEYAPRGEVRYGTRFPTRKEAEEQRRGWCQSYLSSARDTWLERRIRSKWKREEPRR